MLEFKGYKGLLFVGDPHLWSKGPGKRLDKDFFATVVLDKIQQAVEIALKHQLYLVFLGDLFHVHTESDIALLTKLTRILKKLPEPCATVEGNHEKSQTKLSDDVALSLLREAEVIYPMEKSKIWGHFTFKDGSETYLGATPYGETIPLEVKPPKEGGHIIWLTHHNLDFGESYPGVIPVKEIKGVSMLVNGHIHQTKKPVIVGKMKAHNPGNITRLSTDCVDHIPAVWQWLPEMKQDIEPIDLVYEKHVFDLTGKQIVVEAPDTVVADEMSVQQASQFVEKMNQQMKTYDPAKTDDAAYLKDNINALAKAMNLQDDFVQEILEIVDETLNPDNKN